MKTKELKQLKRGSKVKLKKNLLEFWQDNAWELCTSGGVLRPDGANDWFIRKAVALGFPYVAEIQSLMDDTEGSSVKPVPGARVKITVGDLSDVTILSHKELRSA